MPNINSTRLRRFISVAALVCLVLLPAKVTSAWGAGGHMMTAYIAYQRLNSRAKAEVNRLLRLPINPASVSRKSRDFVNASHWADDLRPFAEFKFAAVQHFADFPFSVDGTPVPTDQPGPDNIIVALERNVETLKTSTDDNERAQALRFIIHFVGDIHQPLHASTRVDSAHTEGDRGGNEFNVRVPDANGKLQRKNLHSYWDGGLGSFPPSGANFAPPPLNKIPPAVSVAVNGNPDTSSFLHLDNPTDFAGWAKESSDLAQRKAYDGLEPGGTPNAAYRREGIRIARRRVAWGGYRLAALLNSIWP
jgi:S1/P1 Nuclease